MRNNGLLLAGVLGAAIASCIFAFAPWVAVAIDVIAIGLLSAYASRQVRSGKVDRSGAHHRRD